MPGQENQSGIGLMQTEKANDVETEMPESGEGSEVGEKAEKTNTERIQEEVRALGREKDYNFALINLNGDCVQELIDAEGLDPVLDAMEAMYTDTGTEPSLSELMRQILTRRGDNTKEGREALIQRVQAKKAENQVKYESAKDAGEVSEEMELSYQGWYGYEANAVNIKNNSLDDADQELTLPDSMHPVLIQLKKALSNEPGEDNMGLFLMQTGFDKERIKRELDENEGSLLKVAVENDRKNEEKAKEILEQVLEEVDRIEKEMDSIKSGYRGRYRDAIKPIRDGVIKTLEGLSGNPDTEHLAESILQATRNDIDSLKESLKSERDDTLEPLTADLTSLSALMLTELKYAVRDKAREAKK